MRKKNMQDQFGRKIEYIRVSVTDRCNLRCIYCMPQEGVPAVPHSEILTFDEIERFCRIAAELGISRIKLTGGEPLVRRGLPFLLGKLKHIPGVEQVTLTTNGTLLQEQIRDEKNEIENEINHLFLEQLLSVLEKDERRLIFLRYFQGKTQSEVAGILNVTQVQVSRMEKKLLAKMRESAEREK